MIRVIRSQNRVHLQKSNMHTINSHKEDRSKFLSVPQRNAILTVLRSNPHATPIMVRRVLKDQSPTKKIPADKLQSVRNAVRNERKEMVQVSFGGLQVTDTHGSLTQLCKSMLLSTPVERHNDSDDDFHLHLHQNVVCNYNLDGGNFYFQT